MIDNATIQRGLMAKRDSVSRAAAQRIGQQDARLRELVLEIERLKRELLFHDWLP